MSSVASFIITTVIILSQIEIIDNIISENATLLKAVGSIFLFAYAYVCFFITLGKFYGIKLALGSISPTFYEQLLYA